MFELYPFYIFGMLVASTEEKPMKKPAVQEEHYGALVWVNKGMDKARRDECLCYNCAELDIERDDSQNCPMSGTLYHFCRVTDLALMITRCPKFVPKSEEKEKK